MPTSNVIFKWYSIWDPTVRTLSTDCLRRLAHLVSAEKMKNIQLV